MFLAFLVCPNDRRDEGDEQDHNNDHHHKEHPHEVWCVDDAEDQCCDEHERCVEREEDRIEHRVLDIHNIGVESHHQLARREVIKVLERVLLDLVVELRADDVSDALGEEHCL